MKILVVDDSRTVRRYIGKILQGMGHEYSEAADGAEAMKVVTGETHWNLFLVDYNMPNMNGPEFIAELRKIPQYQKTPVLVVTTESEMTSMQNAADAGATEFIIKPFDKQTFVKMFAMLQLK